MTLAITPKSATSTLLIDVVCIVSSSIGTGNALLAALFQDATAGALAAAVVPSTNVVPGPIAFRHKMTSGTTSATTFKVRAGANGAATTTFNGSAGARLMGGVMASSITITEVI